MGARKTSVSESSGGRASDRWERARFRRVPDAPAVLLLRSKLGARETSDSVTVALSGSAEPPAEPPEVPTPKPPIPIIALVIILILAGILTAFYFRGDPAVMEFGGQ
jgi:hypothetical protein